MRITVSSHAARTHNPAGRATIRCGGQEIALIVSRDDARSRGVRSKSLKRRMSLEGHALKGSI